MSTLLQPNRGKLLTLIFPIVPVLDSNDNKTGSSEGPPYPVTLKDYKDVLEPYGFQIQKGSPYEHEDTISARKGKELVCWWELCHDCTTSKL
jgi:hypothetical protein